MTSNITQDDSRMFLLFERGKRSRHYKEAFILLKTVRLSWTQAPCNHYDKYTVTRSIKEALLVLDLSMAGEWR